jgi:hypothetical protein
MSRNIIFVLVYYRHKHLDLIVISMSEKERNMMNKIRWGMQNAALPAIAIAKSAVPASRRTDSLVVTVESQTREQKSCKLLRPIYEETSGTRYITSDSVLLRNSVIYRVLCT